VFWKRIPLIDSWTSWIVGVFRRLAAVSEGNIATALNTVILKFDSIEQSLTFNTSIAVSYQIIVCDAGNNYFMQF